MEMHDHEKTHPFADQLVLEIEAEVAGSTAGVQEGVARVLEMISERSLGFLVEVTPCEGVLCLLLHRDDVGLPGDPRPTWNDSRPRLELAMDAVAALNRHFEMLGPDTRVDLVTDCPEWTGAGYDADGDGDDEDPAAGEEWKEVPL